MITEVPGFSQRLQAKQEIIDYVSGGAGDVRFRAFCDYYRSLYLKFCIFNIYEKSDSLLRVNENQLAIVLDRIRFSQEEIPGYNTAYKDISQKSLTLKKTILETFPESKKGLFAKKSVESIKESLEHQLLIRLRSIREQVINSY